MTKDRSSRFFGKTTYRSNAPGRDGQVDLYQPRFRTVQPGSGSREVKVGERLDHLAYDLSGDPNGFWQLADANRSFDPTTLTQVGRKIRTPGGRE